MKLLFALFLALISASTFGQNYPKPVALNAQHHFKATVPKGNYSGITWLGGNRYAVVSDKTERSGFYIFTLDIDLNTGDIKQVVSDGFFGSLASNADEEGIAFHSDRNSLFIAHEADNTIYEYDLSGNLTGKALVVPAAFRNASHIYGLESLTYNAATHLFWTTTESTLETDGKQAAPMQLLENRLRLQAFDESLQPVAQYAYKMDKSTVNKPAMNYAMGVADMVALDNGMLLVLERELYVAPKKLGSFVKNKLYSVDTNTAQQIDSDNPLTDASPYMQKQLLAEWKTSLTLFRQDFANYEGMCLGPKLNDGSQVLILCADSQNQYGGILRDWFRTIVFRY
ncbi:esterase-like activity of phytase family protein [Prevotella falsenii]|uniref:esterase-like activity of phytase family protein n=1 Tax=Prevotella falsenii TaxID=515414 RepID=UPI0004686126|nr:esterase-like activity of phytase family protein [Prevotella falsenii]